MDGAPYNLTLLEMLARAEGPAADRALLEALQAGRDDLQAAVLRAMLNRGGLEIRLRLSHLLPALDSKARRVILQDPATLETIARLGMDEEDTSVRLNVIALIDEAGVPSCAYLLAAKGSDPVALVRAQAGKALLRLLQRHNADSEGVTDHIAPAISHAMRSYSFHQSSDILKAAILLGFRCGQDILEQMDRPANRFSGPLTAALKELPPSGSAEFVLSALRYRTVGAVAQSYIAQGGWPTLAAIGSREHWLMLTPVQKALAEIRNLRAVADDPAGLSDLPQAEQPAALRLVMTCGIPQNLKDTLLGLALTGEESAAKAALPFVLGARQHATELVLMALHSQHAEVQSVAAARIIAGGGNTNLTEHLLESLPRLAEPVRGMVSQFLAADSFERYWRSFKHLGTDVRAAAGQALLKLDKRVVDLLAGRLIGRDVTQQLQAVQMVRQLKMSRHFENSLCQLARHGDKMVRSAAVVALGEVDTFGARSTLARCLHDSDSRVQANAVEALAASGGDPSGVLDKAGSENNRVRGNAILWLLQAHHAQGDMALASMLTDGRTPHRISALWVVRKLRHAPAAAILDRMALNDMDAKVRARAATVLRELTPVGTVGQQSLEEVTA